MTTFLKIRLGSLLLHSIIFHSRNQLPILFLIIQINGELLGENFYSLLSEKFYHIPTKLHQFHDNPAIIHTASSTTSPCDSCVETNVPLFIFASCFCRLHYLSANPLHLNCKFISGNAGLNAKRWFSLYNHITRWGFDFSISLLLDSLS